MHSCLLNKDAQKENFIFCFSNSLFPLKKILRRNTGFFPPPQSSASKEKSSIPPSQLLSYLHEKEGQMHDEIACWKVVTPTRPVTGLWESDLGLWTGLPFGNAQQCSAKRRQLLDEAHSSKEHPLCITTYQCQLTFFYRNNYPHTLLRKEKWPAHSFSSMGENMDTLQKLLNLFPTCRSYYVNVILHMHCFFSGFHKHKTKTKYTLRPLP